VIKYVINNSRHRYYDTRSRKEDCNVTTMKLLRTAWYKQPYLCLYLRSSSGTGVAN
jgi:hypothetical protein